jgi:site-specific DNA recombinase
MSKAVRVATYRRISTDERQQPYSLEVQAERLASYIKSQGWQQVADYSDQATGTKLDRPGLQQALQAAQRHSYDVLLVVRVDRLARRCYAAGQFLDLLAKTGAAFVSATEGFDTRTPAGRMMLQILLSFAEFEAESIRERREAGIAKARDKGSKFGRPASIPPYVLTQLRTAHPKASTYRLWQLVQAEGFQVAYSTVTRSLKRHAG